MRTTTALLLIACLAVAQAADTAKFTAYETSTTCTAGTVTTDTAKVPLAPLGTLTSGTCTQVGTLTKYVKFIGTSTAPTSLKTYLDSGCVGGVSVVASTVTITDATCFALDTTNTNAAASASSMKITYSSANTNWAALYYADATCTTAVTASTVNKLAGIGATIASSGVNACVQIGTTGVYYKLVATTTTYTSFKTYPESTCTDAADVTASTLAYNTCLSPVAGWITGTSTAPQFKITYAASTNGMNMAVSFAALLALIIAALF